MLNAVKQNILFVLANAGAVDYLAYAWIFFAFVFLLFFAVFIASKSWWQFGFLIILADVWALVIGIYYANTELNAHLRPTSISEVATKQLEYSNSLMVDFNLTNVSNKTFKICKIDLNFYLASPQPTRDFINSLNPFARKSIIIREPLAPKEIKQISAYVEPFSFIDYNIAKKSECF